MSSRRKKTKSTKGRSKTTQDLNEIESQSQEQITQKSNEMDIEESFENDLLQLVENLGLLEKNSTRVKTRAKSYWDTNPTGIKTILNQIIDQELPMDELAECSSTALNHVAVLRYAGRYYRGKIKTLYEEVKRLQTALQHSEKKVGHVLETSLIQNVVNTYLNKGEFRQKKRYISIFLCYVPSHSRCRDTRPHKLYYLTILTTRTVF